MARYNLAELTRLRTAPTDDSQTKASHPKSTVARRQLRERILALPARAMRRKRKAAEMIRGLAAKALKRNAKGSTDDTRE